jgi:polysaccharide export outer membrane protein
MIRLFRFAAFSTIVLVWLAGGIAFGQFFNDKESQSNSQSNLTQQLQQQQSIQNIKTAVLDGPINPAEYIVGPGDIYSVNVWISPPVSFQLPVTPEGSIIIPTVGEVHVAGLHLDEAKKKVVADVRKKYIAGDISFILMTPRVFAVTVKGVVKQEGTVYVQATERVNAAITLANAHENQTQKNMLIEEKTKSLPNNLIVKPDSVGSQRRIVIRHKDGTTSTADLEKYFVQQDPHLNPLLQDGDVVIVPKRNLDKDFIGVYGAVNKEGTYEFVQGDCLISMLKIARGLTELADSSHVEITRSDSAGDHINTFTVNLSSIVAGESPDILLQSGDRIVVREKPELRRDYKVFVEGEVMYPGYYPITRDSTTLTEIIQRAGGFKEGASLELARLYRKVRTFRNVPGEKLEMLRGISMQEDSTYYQLENNIRTDGEIVVADFVSLFAKDDKSKDVYLQDGDHIIIPQEKKTVYVFGEVVHPGHIAFEKNRGYQYYVEKAGGLTDDALSGDIKIIKANDRQWLSPSETTIEEGDYVWIPKEPYRPFSYYLQIYSQVFGIIGTVATVAVLVVQLKK